MAEKTVLISQQLLKPIKILKWKIKEGSPLSIGRVLLLYDFDGVIKMEQRKLKSTHAGTVIRLIADEGAIVKSGDPLLELVPCIHPTVMNDMCAECGADLRRDDSVSSTAASVSMVHAIPELKVSEELAQKLGKIDGEHLLKDRKLVLLVDLDQTLIHTTNDNIPPNIKDVYHFQLYRASNSPWYHTRLRPRTHNFLNNISPLFELHICTFGARNYAHTIAMYLDPDQRYFSNRILSRDECFDPTSKKANLKALFPCGDNMVCIIDDREDVWSHALNLIHVKPYHFFQHTGDINAPPGLDKHEQDDKEGIDLSKITSKKVDYEKNDKDLEKTNEEVEVTVKDVETEEKEEISETKTNETEVTTNNGFTECLDKSNVNGENGTKDDEQALEENQKDDKKVEKVEEEEQEEAPSTNGNKESSTLETKEEDLIEIEDPDDYLFYLEDILKKIHKKFYEEYDRMESGDVPDLKKVIPCVRSQVLSGTNLVFSGLVPTHIKLEQSKAYQVARSLGARVTQNLEDNTTHIVAVRPGTAKVNAGRRKKNLKIVTPDWLWACAERWEHVDEQIFPLNSKGSKNRHPPPHCSSPEHITNYPVHDMPASIRKRTPSGRFMDTINPLMSFSSDDIADMDKEVEDILDDESDTEEEGVKNEKVEEPNETAERCNSSSSSSAESLTAEFPRGFKRAREKLEEDDEQRRVDNNGGSSNDDEDEEPSNKIRKNLELENDLDIEQDTNSDGSVEAPDEADDGEWNMMGAALEREFLSNN